MRRATAAALASRRFVLDAVERVGSVGEAQQRAESTLREQAENFWLPPYKRTPPLPIAPWQRPADDLHEFVLDLVERVEALTKELEEERQRNA